MTRFLPFSLPPSFQKLQEDAELEWLRQTEVLYYRLERSHSNAVPQLKHNPWSLKCQQHHLQKMKENAKHRNQYSILSPRTDGLKILYVNRSKDTARPWWHITGIVLQHAF